MKTTTTSKAVRGDHLPPVLYNSPLVNLRSSPPPDSRRICPTATRRPSSVWSRCLQISSVDWSSLLVCLIQRLLLIPIALSFPPVAAHQKISTVFLSYPTLMFMPSPSSVFSAFLSVFGLSHAREEGRDDLVLSALNPQLPHSKSSTTKDEKDDPWTVQWLQ